ncbi:ATP synthase regulation protein NCA2 [Plectosphaerella cucumerina]|uniref:ATP synthase regulation protein NCA2 n=1 Tax=Plectosphaerella cucumerina TaxID=40658 RepID=A0A8K0X9P0_9PEZI|nr:ATP synthase regulation protein NCA2 [Plectosphaerella cucumerina]
MSFATDQVRQLDAELDRISLGFGRLDQHDQQDDSIGEDAEQEFIYETTELTAARALSTPRITELLHIVKALSSSASSHSQLSSYRIRHLLQQSKILRADRAATATAQSGPEARHQADVEWLLVSKATVQTYGLILGTLLDQIIPLSDEIWYWEEVTNSYRYSSLYAIQTTPLRLWDLYKQIKPRWNRLGTSSPGEVVDSAWSGLTQPWVQFYGLVRDSIRDRSFATVQGKMLSPVALSKREARKKLAALRKMRNMISASLGFLVDEGLLFDLDGEEAFNDLDFARTVKWKTVVSKTIVLMDTVLRDVLSLQWDLDEFEHKVFDSVEDDPEFSVSITDANATEKATVAAERLLNVLDYSLPDHNDMMEKMVTSYGRPSIFVRYWLPATVLALSSTTIFRILLNRRAELMEWARDIGTTIHDFWANWVITPIAKVVRTIRHDETSEIAIMSRDSLKADRESLERMVVDFATDNPHFAGAGGSTLNETELATIRAKVAEGDVTPVLKAYEQDLRSPFKGAVRGDLVRSLLIQVQKTKVDLEVAISGIDALLRSQELVFGFVGLTPGILVSIGLFRYLRGTLGGREGARNSRQAGQSVRVLRNIDRIFSEATPTKDNVLSYKDHGLLLCETHVLRSLMHRILPRDVEKEFLEDLEDLAKLKGFETQRRALDRIKWAYSKWLK